MRKKGYASCAECHGEGVIACSHCGGTGLSDTCRDCNGDGVIACVHCDGAGGEYDERGTWIVCKYCKGKKKKCPTCRGKGKIPCVICKGTGLESCYECQRKKYEAKARQTHKREIKKKQDEQEAKEMRGCLKIWIGIVMIVAGLLCFFVGQVLFAILLILAGVIISRA